MNNRNLLIIFVALLAIYFGMNLFSRSDDAKPTGLQCTWRTYGCLKEVQLYA